MDLVQDDATPRSMGYDDRSTLFTSDATTQKKTTAWRIHEANTLPSARPKKQVLRSAGSLTSFQYFEVVSRVTFGSDIEPARNGRVTGASRRASKPKGKPRGPCLRVLQGAR